ncbi:MAG: Ig-like domain-containing protein [Candidatus Dormiibacterota bacterium]
MARISRWFRRSPVPEVPPSGVDPDLWSVFVGREGHPDPELFRAADQLRTTLQSQHRPTADPAYQARLRASLIREAREARAHRTRSRRLVWPLGATLAGAAVALAAVVSLSTGTLPLRAGQVKVQAAVAGHHEIPVTKAIQLSFNQPMDEAAVVQGLRISPAVTYRTSWPNPKTLVISPAQGLAPNVGYVVTIAATAAKAQDGSKASAEIVIPFGTTSTPSTPIGQTPSVVSVTTPAVGQGITSLAYTPDGALMVLSSGGLAANSPTSQPSAASSAAVPQPTASPSVGPIPVPATGTVYLLSPSLTIVAANAVGAVVSPDGEEVAYWSPEGNGSLALEVVDTSGKGTPQTLAFSTDSAPGLGWLDDGDLLFAAAGQLREVSLDGQISAVDPSIQLDPSGFFSLSPSAESLFARPAGVATVYSLPSGTASTLPNLVGEPTWSSGGSALAYVTNGGGMESIESSSDSGANSEPILTAADGVQLANLSYDPTGTYLAYTAALPGQSSQLEAVDVQTKVVASLGNLTSVSGPVWAPAGGQLSELVGVAGTTSQDVDTLLLSGTPLPPVGDGTAAESALSTATSLGLLQLTQGPAALASITALLAPGTTFTPSILLPGKFDHAYAVSTTPTAAGASTFTVQLRLVRDATSSSGAAFLPETVTVQTAGVSPLITAIVPGALTPVPTGPLVVSASASTTKSGATIFAIQFNSALNPHTAGPQTITLSVAGKVLTGLQFDYSPLTRTETVTAQSVPSGTVTLTVSPPLADINNTQMQSLYQVMLQPLPAASS